MHSEVKVRVYFLQHLSIAVQRGNADSCWDHRGPVSTGLILNVIVHVCVHVYIMLLTCCYY